LLAEGLGDPSTEKNLLAELRWRGADGVILIAPRLSVEDIDRESRGLKSITTLVVGWPPSTCSPRAIRGLRISPVVCRRRVTRAAAPALTAALQAAGMQSDPRLVIELERHTVQPWPDYDLGYEQGARLAAVRAEFDAVLAYSDAIAIGAHRALPGESVRTRSGAHSRDGT
jgi:DNA-binding LacI/PurR family transcriptional regulator